MAKTLTACRGECSRLLHYESCGRVALEAVVRGTLVVASEVGGLAFWVRRGETHFQVPDQDPEPLAKQVCRLITNPDLPAKLSERAASCARGFA